MTESRSVPASHLFAAGLFQPQRPGLLSAPPLMRPTTANPVGGLWTGARVGPRMRASAISPLWSMVGR